MSLRLCRRRYRDKNRERKSSTRQPARFFKNFCWQQILEANRFIRCTAKCGFRKERSCKLMCGMAHRRLSTRRDHGFDRRLVRALTGRVDVSRLLTWLDGESDVWLEKIRQSLCLLGFTLWPEFRLGRWYERQGLLQRLSRCLKILIQARLYACRSNQPQQVLKKESRGQSKQSLQLYVIERRKSAFDCWLVLFVYLRLLLLLGGLLSMKGKRPRLSEIRLSRNWKSKSWGLFGRNHCPEKANVPAWIIFNRKIHFMSGLSDLSRFWRSRRFAF